MLIGYFEIFKNNSFLSFKNDDETVGESICYYYLHRHDQEPNTEYLVCLIVEDSKYDLDLFRNELDFYFEQYLKSHFNQKVAFTQIH
jgi:hypothetical protein